MKRVATDCLLIDGRRRRPLAEGAGSSRGFALLERGRRGTRDAHDFPVQRVGWRFLSGKSCHDACGRQLRPFSQPRL